MTNASYTPFKTNMMDGAIDLKDSVIKVGLFRGGTAWPTNLTQTTMADLTAGGAVINGTAVPLTGKVLDPLNGTFTAADVQITTTANASSHYIVIYQASAVGGSSDVAAASQLLCFYFDTGTNLPIVPGTGTVSIAWSTGAAKIYKIG